MPRFALLALVLVPIVVNAVALWPEVSIPVPSLNDDATHVVLVERASEALARGENPFDHWGPQFELGFPWFLYYQHVPHLAVVFLHRLLLKTLDLLTVFNLVRYLIMVAFPLVVYWSMRRMTFSPVAAAVGAAASSLLNGGGSYGFEFGSYIWRGHGMFTQLWAMPLTFVTLACLYRLLNTGTGYLAAILACSTLALTHLVYSYMLAISALVLLVVGLDRANVVARVGRLAVVGGIAGVISSYMTVSFLRGAAFLGESPYLQRAKYDSYGAERILRELVNGDMLDADRLPVLTVLLALGLTAAALTRTRPATLALALFGVWLMLYFGRPTLGRLADVLPMHEGLLMHRFVGSVHVAAILLMGLGGEWLWARLSRVPARWRAAAVAGLVLVLLLPALGERWIHYQRNTEFMQRARRAIDADTDVRAVLASVAERPPGRSYAGLRADWGSEVQFGGLRLYDLLTFNRFVAVTPPYGSWSLNADIVWHFDDKNPAHYEVMGVRNVIAPRRWPAPPFLRAVKETPRYVLYEAPSRSYGELAAISHRESPASKMALFLSGRAWFLGPGPAARTFVRYDYPSRPPSGAGEPAAVPGCPEGRSVDERILPGRVDLRVECPTASALVIKVTYHPNWRVSVDGREVPTFMVSPSLLAIEVPPGSHAVSARYRSGRLRWVLMGLGAATLAAAIVFRRRFAQLETLWRVQR